MQLPKDSLSLIMGKPECGKTTLSRIMAGLVPRHTGGTLKGKMYLPGLTSGMPAPQKLMDTLGLIFQDADEQIIMTRCDWEVAFPLESLQVPRQEMVRRVAAALEALGLEKFRERNPGRMSGGEKRKLLLAVLYAQRPDLWILDETLEEIDAPARRQILSFLSERQGGAVVFSSRYSAPLRGYFSQAAVLTPSGFNGPFSLEKKEDLLPALKRDGLFLESSKGLEEPRPSRGEELMKAEGIEFSYPEADSFTLRVEGFSLHRGETVCLVGRNGCGKSTLGRILCGLLRPDKGRLSFHEDGESEKPAHPDDLRRRVGYIFQNPDYQIFLPTVREELLYGLPKDQGTVRKVEEAAELFSLENLDAPPALLSYGTRKRLQAACYYLLKRRIYILDEADSGISYEDFSFMLRSLSDSRGSVVVITHDLELARVVGDRLCIMKDGRIISEYPRGFAGPVRELEE
ncbi:MAG: ABC transporter ATP-binding protein [Spirochaetales bacterium]|nr:ABC transporter ATP-binding protein [Spirochaetales bacterium]